MGSNFVNFQVKSTDAAAVIAAATGLVQARAYVSPVKTGWVTLYDEKCESQDAYEIGRIGEELSLKLNTAVLVILVHDSTLLVYYLFDNSDLLDEYNSNPPPVNPNANTDQRYRFMGRPEILLNYCPAGTPRAQIEKALLRGNALSEGGFATNMFAEERLRRSCQRCRSTRRELLQDSTISNGATPRSPTHHSSPRSAGNR